jgi:hypothetical protein
MARSTLVLVSVLAACHDSHAVSSSTVWEAPVVLASASEPPAGIAVAQDGQALAVYSRGGMLLARPWTLGSWTEEQLVGSGEAQVESLALLSDTSAALIVKSHLMSFRRSASGTWSGPHTALDIGNQLRTSVVGVTDIRGDMLAVEMSHPLPAKVANLWAARNDAAPGDPEWSSPVLQTGGMLGSFSTPAAALGPQGIGVVAWFERDADAWSLVAQRSTALLGFEPRATLAPARGTPTQCALAIDALGRVHLVWASESLGITTLYTTRFTLETGWTVPIGLASSHTGMLRLKLVADPEGNAVATWNEVRDGAIDIMVCSYDGLSGRWSVPELLAARTSPETVGPSLGRDDDVAIGPDHNAYVVWIQREGNSPETSGSEVRLRMRTGSWVWQPPRTLDAVPAGAMLAGPRVAASSGHAVALWMRTVDHSTVVVAARMH